MEHKKFLAWLTELTYWQYPRIDQKEIDPRSKNNRHLVQRQLAELDGCNEEEEVLEDCEEDQPYVKNGINETRNPIILSVKHQNKVCEDCGLVCKDRRIEQKLYQYPETHWRRRCLTCNLIQNPDTGVYELHPPQAIAYFKGKFSNKNK